jgi:hypothetical protein
MPRRADVANKWLSAVIIFIQNAEMLVSVGAEGLSENDGMGDEGIEPSTAALRVRCSTN